MYDVSNTQHLAAPFSLKYKIQSIFFSFAHENHFLHKTKTARQYANSVFTKDKSVFVSFSNKYLADVFQN